MLDTLVAIVRLSGGPEGLPASPEILACNLGAHVTDIEMMDTSFLHLSKRVLVTVVDTHKPHVVFCARVNDLGQTVDALYVDILQDRSSKEMFDFIEAVARQINFTQKNLFFTELKKQEEALRDANTKLKEKDRIKDEYVSRVTHDIKGHLAAIRSCLFIASDESTGPLNERQGLDVEPLS